MNHEKLIALTEKLIELKIKEKSVFREVMEKDTQALRDRHYRLCEQIYKLQDRIKKVIYNYTEDEAMRRWKAK